MWVLHIMISCAGVTWSVGITHHDQLCWGDRECGTHRACTTQIAGLNPQSSRAQVAEGCCMPVYGCTDYCSILYHTAMYCTVYNVQYYQL